MPTRAQLNTNLANVLTPIIDVPQHLQANQMMLDYVDQLIAGVSSTTWELEKANYYTKNQVDVVLSLKANATHTHAIADVTGLQAALDSKATPYTFLNGLTEAAGTVKLGGALTQNTTIDFATYGLTIGNAASSNLSIGSEWVETYMKSGSDYVNTYQYPVSYMIDAKSSFGEIVFKQATPDNTGTLEFKMLANSTTDTNSFILTAGTSTMIFNNAEFKLSKLAGSGTRMVVADLNGNLTTQAIPSYTGTNFILNQTTQQATANFNISGDGTIGGKLLVGYATSQNSSYLAQVNGNLWLGGGIQMKSSDTFISFKDSIGSDKMLLNWDASGVKMQSYEGKPLFLNPTGNKVFVATTTDNGSYNFQVSGGIYSGSGNTSVSRLLVNTTSLTSGFAADIAGSMLVSSGVYVGSNQSLRMMQSGGVDIIGSHAAATPLAFYQAGIEKARIDTNGYLLVGFTASQGTYVGQFNGGIYASGTSQHKKDITLAGGSGYAQLNILNATGAGSAGSTVAATFNKLNVNGGGGVVSFPGASAGTYNNLYLDNAKYSYTTNNELSATLSKLDIFNGSTADKITNVTISTQVEWASTVGTLIDLYIPGWVTSTAGNTVSNYYGVFQGSSTAKNYFGGKLMLGSTTDAGSYQLQVTGAVVIDNGNTTNRRPLTITNKGAGATGIAIGGLTVGDTSGSIYQIDLANSRLQYQVRGSGGQTATTSSHLFTTDASASTASGAVVGIQGGGAGADLLKLMQSDGTPVFKVGYTGNATLSSLAGTGSRMVVADASGVLSTQAIPNYTFSNGMNALSGAVKLGGALTQDTVINVGANTFYVGDNFDYNDYMLKEDQYFEVYHNAAGIGDFDFYTSPGSFTMGATTNGAFGQAAIGLGSTVSSLAINSTYHQGSNNTDSYLSNSVYNNSTAKGSEYDIYQYKHELFFLRPSGQGFSWTVRSKVDSGAFTDEFKISEAGVLIRNLAGTGSRMVVADASGNLATQALPTLQTVTTAGNTTTTAINATKFGLTSGGTSDIVSVETSGSFGAIKFKDTMFGATGTLVPLFIPTNQTWYLPQNSGTLALQSSVDTKQAQNNNLTSISNFSGTNTGYAKRNSDGTWVLDTPSGGSVTSLQVINDTNYTVTTTDTHIVFRTVTATRTLTLPTASGNANRKLLIRNGGSASVTLSQTIMESTGTGSTSLAAAKFVEIISDGTDWWITQKN